MSDELAPTWPKDRALRLDVLRCLSALLVLVYHLAFTATFRVPGAAVWPVAQYGFVGVDIFFVISGYVILQSVLDHSPTHFALSRLIRLLPAFAACMVLTALVTGAVKGRGLDLRLLLANLTFFPGVVGMPYIDDVYWSLSEEVTFYILIASLVMVVRPQRLAAAFTIVVGVHLIQRFLSYAGLDPIAVVELPVSPWFAFFGLGMAARWWSSGHRSACVATLFVVSVATATLVEIDRTKSLAAYRGISLSPAIPLTLVALAVAFVCMPSDRTLNMPPWRYLLLAASGSTYPLYLLHQEIGYRLLSQMLRLGAPRIATPLLVGVAIIALSVAVHCWFDAPLRSWLQRRFGLCKPI